MLPLPVRLELELPSPPPSGVAGGVANFLVYIGQAMGIGGEMACLLFDALLFGAVYHATFLIINVATNNGFEDCGNYEGTNPRRECAPMDQSFFFAIIALFLQVGYGFFLTS